MPYLYYYHYNQNSPCFIVYFNCTNIACIANNTFRLFHSDYSVTELHRSLGKPPCTIKDQEPRLCRKYCK